MQIRTVPKELHDDLDRFLALITGGDRSVVRTQMMRTWAARLRFAFSNCPELEVDDARKEPDQQSSG
jgi:hypothetical protein